MRPHKCHTPPDVRDRDPVEDREYSPSPHDNMPGRMNNDQLTRRVQQQRNDIRMLQQRVLRLEDKEQQ